MLVDFCVKNFKSFDDKQIFSLLKDKGDENLDNTFIVGKKQKLQLLKCAAIYGANASGKSNLIDALQTMKSIVLFSLKHVNSINLFPFKLAKRNLSEPTEFEVTIVVNDVRYQYGFSATAAKIVNDEAKKVGTDNPSTMVVDLVETLISLSPLNKESSS